MGKTFERMDRAIVSWMGANGITVLRLSLGIVFLWFGLLKYFPHQSPAETLASETILVLTFGHVGPHVSLPILATWECLIGLGLIAGLAKRLTLFLLFTQMLGTLLPLFL